MQSLASEVMTSFASEKEDQHKCSWQDNSNNFNTNKSTGDHLLDLKKTFDTMWQAKKPRKD